MSHSYYPRKMCNHAGCEMVCSKILKSRIGYRQRPEEFIKLEQFSPYKTILC